MLEQWEAERLLTMPKIYTYDATISLDPGSSQDHPLESHDGTEFFLLDVRRSRRNPQNVRLQLRYRRDVVLARLCLSKRHRNPDQELINAPHFHKYREGYDDKFAEDVDPFVDIAAALGFFCKQINVPMPAMQGGNA